MARPPINAKGELLFRQQLDAALDYVEALSGGIADGDKGDITVSGGGTVWTIDSGSHTHVAADVTDLATTVQAYTLDTFANPVASMDFAQQQSLQFVIENRTSDPGAPATGQLWLRVDL